MKRYDEYKQTGTPWIGEIPSHWEAKPIKVLGSFRKGVTFTKADLVDEGNAVISYGQIHSKLNNNVRLCDELIRYIPDSIIEGQFLSITKPGDFVFADTSEDLEGCGNHVLIEKREFPIYAGYHTIILKRSLDANNNRYLSYLFRTDLWRSQLRDSVSGVKVYSITQQILSSAKIILPPFSEQEAIAAYLDKKCGAIDKVIATQERRIALLEELKQSVITEGVTHGINPDAKLRPSGIDWIGNIPEHWQVMPFKRTMRICNGCDYKEFEAEAGFPVIGSGGTFAYASDYLYDGEALLLGRKGTIDKPLYFNGKFWTVDTMFYSVPYKNVCCKYMYYQSLNFPFDKYSTSTALPSMTSKDLGNNIVCVPPLSEQQEIVAYIESKIKPIDASISKAKREIELLKELKQSVITEAVTGKIKVC